LFAGSLRYNLDPINKFKDEEIWDILEKVCMKETFSNKNGLDSIVYIFYDFLNLLIYVFLY